MTINFLYGIIPKNPDFFQIHPVGHNWQITPGVPWTDGTNDWTDI